MNKKEKKVLASSKRLDDMLLKTEKTMLENFSKACLIGIVEEDKVGVHIVCVSDKFQPTELVRHMQHAMLDLLTKKFDLLGFSDKHKK